MILSHFDQKEHSYHKIEAAISFLEKNIFKTDLTKRAEGIRTNVT